MLFVFGKEAEERTPLFGAELELPHVGFTSDGWQGKTIENDRAKKRAPEELKGEFDSLAPADAFEEDEPREPHPLLFECGRTEAVLLALDPGSPQGRMLAEEASHPAMAGQAQDLDPLAGMEAEARQMAEHLPRPGRGVFCEEGLQCGERGAGHTNSIPNKNRTRN